jgi:hypothetical protein
MRLRTTILLCLPLLILTSFFRGKNNDRSIQSLEVPGVEQIDEQLYMDRTEVTNFHWLEYLFWAKRIYGQDSPEYQAILPDTSLWNAESDKLKGYTDFYLRHRAFYDYPVVGLSYEQMKAYCKWRSDRVFEYMLIRLEKITWDSHPTPKTFFTTEKYLHNAYLHYRSDSSIAVVPHYYLPSAEEWKKTDLYNQAVYAAVSRRRLRKRSPDVYYSTLQLSEPLQPVDPPKHYCISGVIYNLHRNVSEQLSDSLLAAGANWKQLTTIDEGENMHFQPEATVTKGFRCAFTWKPAR